MLTMASWLVSGLPRQFIDMWENSQCTGAAGSASDRGAGPAPRQRAPHPIARQARSV
jgi:hypothetical protein